MGVNFDIKDSEKLFSKIPCKRILAVVSLITAFLIFFPDKILEKVFLLQLRNNLKVYLGITFVICISIWIVIIVSTVFKRIFTKRKFRGKDAKKRFGRLSTTALVIVLEMYVTPSYAKELPYNSATAHVLECLSFVTRGSLSTCGVYYDYALQPWVVDYLDKHYKEYEKIVNESK